MRSEESTPVYSSLSPDRGLRCSLPWMKRSSSEPHKEETRWRLKILKNFDWKFVRSIFELFKKRGENFDLTGNFNLFFEIMGDFWKFWKKKVSNHMCARKKSCKKKTVPGIYEVTRAFFVKKGRSASNSIVLKFFQREAFVRLNRDAVIIGLWPCHKLYYVFQKKWIHSLKWKMMKFRLWTIFYKCTKFNLLFDHSIHDCI